MVHNVNYFICLWIEALNSKHQKKIKVFFLGGSNSDPLEVDNYSSTNVIVPSNIAPELHVVVPREEGLAPITQVLKQLMMKKMLFKRVVVLRLPYMRAPFISFVVQLCRGLLGRSM